MYTKGHKEQVISEKWAREIYEMVKEPVCVTVGIHYDNLSKLELMRTLEETDKLLEESKD